MLAPSPKRRIYELDALRGIAAFAVVLYHFYQRYDQIYGHSFSFSNNISYGKLGVELFFLISGFVIFLSLDRIKSRLDFPVARFARLFPAYWFAVILTFTSVAVFGLPGREATFGDAALNLTMLQGYMRNVEAVDGVYWTLTKELSFYALMYLLFLTKQLKHIEAWCLGWLGLSLAYMFQLDGMFQGHWSYILFNQLLITDYAHLFVAGICFYRVYARKSSDLTIALLVLSLAMNGLMYQDFSLFLVASFYCLFLILILLPIHFLKNRVLLFLGGITYSLYLIHQNVGYLIIRQGYLHGVHPFISILGAIAVVVGLAYVSHRYIEMPANRAIRARYQQWQDARKAKRQAQQAAPVN